MVHVDSSLSTGQPGLDSVIRGLIPGDNIVWRLTDTADYGRYASAFAAHAIGRGRRVNYFQFAPKPLDIPAQPGLRRIDLQPELGFEKFIAEVHAAIDEDGGEGVHIFDCLSDMAADWYSDAMLANFYMLTCPMVYDLGALAYFSLRRQRHSTAALTPIFDTAQVVLDLYRHQGRTYVHPLKVLHRHAATMHLLHDEDEGRYTLVSESAVAADVLAKAPTAEVGIERHRVDVWHQVFHEAERLMAAIRDGDSFDSVPEEVRERLLRMVISRDERVLDLVRQHMGVEDLLDIGRRCIGTGLIGGKAVGMLLARSILRGADQRWHTTLEHHDSFFICSDVFYSYLVHNGTWWVRQNQRKAENLLRDAKRARQRILTGTFPPQVVAQFERMLGYFGQSPIIVRSSSLLEDNFGNAFAGKYESVFCVNQGLREQRLRDFLSAVRTIYASSMSEKALQYRQGRGLLDLDEQMALLVQRVSGTMHGQMVLPHVAGVALSHNPYVWHETIDPKAGMLRLVFGLGTRAVDRADDDYTRVVALNEPQRAPDLDGANRPRAQSKVDVLDLAANQLISVPIHEMLPVAPGLPLQLLATRDHQAESASRERARGREVQPIWHLDFHNLLRQSDGLIEDMRQMMQTLSAAYGQAVDVEFTVNFSASGGHRIDLVQCRPLQFLGHAPVAAPPEAIPDADQLLSSSGPVIGQSRCVSLDRIILVDSQGYAALSQRDRYSLARLIGKATRLPQGQTSDPAILLIGPGRWGTTSPSLGVPISFGEISTVEAICEVVDMGGNLVPDVSLGTHFFNDLVEEEILYLAYYPERSGCFARETLLAAPSRTLELLGDEATELTDALRIIDASDLAPGRSLNLYADCVHQRALIWRD